MLLGISSQTAISLNPLADSFRDMAIPIRGEFSRNADASLRRANELKYLRWEFEVDFVTASNASIIQSLWTSAASLLFWPDENTWPNSAYSVMLLNQNKPLDEWSSPHYLKFRTGDLIIETTSSGLGL